MGSEILALQGTSDEDVEASLEETTTPTQD
jgi:hypothetical protein